MKSIFYIIFLLFITNFTYSNTFQNANLEFSNNNYTEAESLYIDDLKENGNDINTLYNLSNIYLKQNQLGKALYYLYLARIYSPLDLNIKNEIKSIEEILEISNQYKYIIPISNLSLLRLNLVIIFLIVLIITLSQIFEDKFKIKSNKIILITLITLFLVTFIPLMVNKLDSNSGIILTKTDVKVSPYESSENSFKINPGLKIKIKDDFNDYYFIEDLNNRYGWVNKKDLGLLWKN